MICPKYALQNLLGSVLFVRPVSSSIHSFAVMLFLCSSLFPPRGQCREQKAESPASAQAGSNRCLWEARKIRGPTEPWQPRITWLINTDGVAGAGRTSFQDAGQDGCWWKQRLEPTAWS